MPRRAKEEAEKTRARILASALELFAEKGYERTTFTDIAARLEMTKGAVYWHFASKEVLLIALVDDMLERFRQKLEEVMPTGELTFPAVADMMVANAEQIVENPNGMAFFRLMKCQIRWTDASMQSVREDLLRNDRVGPYRTFCAAIRNDIAAGRVRAGVVAEQVASCCIALWDGLVQSRVDKFLPCDLHDTLTNAYHAVWESIRVLS